MQLAATGAVRMVLSGASKENLTLALANSTYKCLLTRKGSSEPANFEEFLAHCRRMQGQSSLLLGSHLVGSKPQARAITNSGYSTNSSHEIELERERGSSPHSIQTDGRAYELPSYTASQLISEFAERVLEILTPQQCESVRSNMALISASPETMLSDYAILLEGTANDIVHEQALTSIRHQRKQVAKEFADSVLAWKKDPTDGMSSNDKVDLWKRLLEETGNEGHNQADREDNATSGPVDGNATNDITDVPDPQDAPSLPSQIPEARKFLLDGAEFTWLLNSLQRSIDTMQTGSSYNAVRTRIVETLHTQGVGGGLELDLQWKPYEFLAEYTMGPQFN